MTNEEKANQIALENQFEHGGFVESFICGYVSAISMAEWKDSVSSKIMEEIIKKFNDYPDNAVFGKSNIIDVLKEIKKVIEK